MTTPQPKIITGRAAAVDGRNISFSDPAWDPVFDELIKLTKRTELIQELMGIEIKTARLKDFIRRRLDEMGFEFTRPRGCRQSESSKSFLSSPASKSDGAYLLGMHFGSKDPLGGTDTQTLNLMTTLQRNIAVYRAYVRDLYGDGTTPVYSFETYILLVKAVKNHTVVLSVCNDCGSRQPILRGASMRPSCSVCRVQNLAVEEARGKLSAMLNQQRVDYSKSYGLSVVGR